MVTNEYWIKHLTRQDKKGTQQFVYSAFWPSQMSKGYTNDESSKAEASRQIPRDKVVVGTHRPYNIIGESLHDQWHPWVLTNRQTPGVGWLKTISLIIRHFLLLFISTHWIFKSWKICKTLVTHVLWPKIRNIFFLKILLLYKGLIKAWVCLSLKKITKP